ncbi:MAG: GTPase Era [Ignavibacteriae bacterium HGW-Ignavibacteriae-1]|jgi:GTP-binding protein Era|nr:MAG: GTPase Era [Ignavibacteriae bacterium HGW-Ignavibacteriae-1]
MQTRAGFVSIIGKPNTGKSTLLNALLGTKLSITNPKPQTTRRKILGILTEDDYQIVFADTPGLLKPRYMMQEFMMDYVAESVAESDVLVLVSDLEKQEPEEIDEKLLEIVKNFKGQTILVLNKIDSLSTKKAALPMIAKYHKMGIFNDIVPMSALYKDNIKKLVQVIKELLPESPFYFDSDLLSTLPERFFVSELIRENVFTIFADEIPYSTEVQINEFKERENGKWYISADIVVERESQKKIVVGTDGNKIKQIGETSRRMIEDHLRTNIYLELFVKVRQNWRNDKSKLKNFGY